MSRFSLVLLAIGLLTACGVPESTEVEQDGLYGAPAGRYAALCCRDKFPPGNRRGWCVAEAQRGRGPCAIGHPGGRGGHECPDAGAGGSGGAGGSPGDQCPSLTAVLASPDATAAGVKFVLSETIADNGSTAAIAYDWHVAAGSVGALQTEPSLPNATFVCTALGPQVVELTITAGNPAVGCTSSGTVTVDCTSLCGNGLVDPGEGCDPPDGFACDATCSPVNHCPTVTGMSPVTADVNNHSSTPVTALVFDPDAGDTLTYAWTVTSGYVFQDITTRTVSYMCTDVGVHTVTVVVSDGKCDDTGSVDINCYAWCGDGVVSPGEQCDPPHLSSDGLQCNSSCQLLTCGNGVIDPGEQCDPPQSGVCNLSCQTAFCGNAVVDPGEQCDPPESGVCTDTCQVVPPPPPPQCAVPSPTASWKLVNQFPSYPMGLWASSPTDAWLTTDVFQETTRLHASEVHRWNGSAWTRVLGDDVSVRYLRVWGSGPTDVWITGDRVRHWDGSAWTDRTPPPVDANHLSFPVGGVAANDVWVAVVDQTTKRQILWHWDGAGWTDRSPPDPAQGPFTAGTIWAVSANDVWVAGRTAILVGGGGVQTGPSVLQHWDGSGWTRVAVAGDPYFTSLWGSAANDIWASPDQNAMYHYDGQIWSQVSVPTAAGVLLGVWGSCSTDVWATGTLGGVHFNGSSWSIDPNMPTGGQPISGTSADDVWIVHGISRPFAPTLGVVYHRSL